MSVTYIDAIHQALDELLAEDPDVFLLGEDIAGTFGGAGVSAMRLHSMLHYELPLDMPQRMLSSLDKIKDEPVEVHLGNHPYNSHTLEKRERQLKEGGNPFVDASTWPEFVADIRQKSLKIMVENEELAREHHIAL